MPVVFVGAMITALAAVAGFLIGFEQGAKFEREILDIRHSNVIGRKAERSDPPDPLRSLL